MLLCLFQTINKFGGLYQSHNQLKYVLCPASQCRKYSPVVKKFAALPECFWWRLPPMLVSIDLAWRACKQPEGFVCQFGPFLPIRPFLKGKPVLPNVIKAATSDWRRQPEIAGGCFNCMRLHWIALKRGPDWQTEARRQLTAPERLRNKVNSKLRTIEDVLFATPFSEVIRFLFSFPLAWACLAGQRPFVCFGNFQFCLVSKRKASQFSCELNFEG